MDISLLHANQAAIFFEEEKAIQYWHIERRAAAHPTLYRFMGLPIAICSGLFTIVEKITALAEGLIKGLANLFGSPFSPKCDLLRGLKQIAFQIPNLAVLIATPLIIGVGGIFTTIGMLASPEKYAKFRKDNHLTIAADLREMRDKNTYKGKPVPLILRLSWV